MDIFPAHPEVSEADLLAGLTDLKGRVNIPEENLKELFSAALRHARSRVHGAVAVSEVMTKDVVAVRRETGLHEAARRLSGLRISGMPVVDDENRVIGVISEADILSLTGMKRGHTFKDVVRHLLGEPLPPRKRGSTVGEIMSAPPITTSPDRDIREVAYVLDERRIKRLPVVDGSGKLVGVVSRADIVRAMSVSRG